jgi:hypothetical protein
MIRNLFATLLLIAAVSAAYADPQTTAFTYQGSLSANGQPANGTYNLTFNLYNVATGGTPLTAAVQVNNVTVTNGAFSVDVNFPGQFTGQQCWIEVAVNGGTPLSPRQPINAVPVAQYAMNAGIPFLLGSVGTTQNDAAILTTGPTPGSTGNAAVLPLSGHLSSPIIVSTIPSPWGFESIYAGVAQTLPVAVNFTKMSGTMVMAQTEIFVPMVATIQAQLYRFQFASQAISPVAGASCTFMYNGINPFQEIVPQGQTANCTNNSIAASFNAGDSGFWLITVTMTGNPYTGGQNMPVLVSMGLSQ